MARGRMQFEPPFSSALSLDGAHNLTLDDATFNMGAGDFAVDALIRITNASADYPLITFKGDPAAGTKCGWKFYVTKSTGTPGLDINDGNVAGPLYISGTPGSVPLDTDLWLGLQADRDGQARFFVNGLDAGGGSIAGRPGTLDHTDPLNLGNGYAGNLHFVRFDKGRIIPVAWYADEWNRIKYGYPRSAIGVTEIFDFPNSLVGRNGRVLTWQGGGSPAYVDGWPYSSGLATLDFEYNFAFGSMIGFGEAPAFERAMGGAGVHYLPYIKRKATLEFKNINTPQKQAIMAACLAGADLNFYWDADLPESFQACFLKDPNWRQENYNVWSGSVEIGEI